MEKGAPIRSITRSIAVLKAINRHGSLSMTSIAKATGLSYPTTYRVVDTLVQEGLIEQEPSRKFYRPTAGVQELAVGYQPHNGLVTVARPHIVALTREIGWPVSIGSRVGTNMVLRDSTHADTTLTFERYPPGFTFPLFGSASGLLCLAHTSEEGVTEAFRCAREIGEDATGALSQPPHDFLETIRKQGYATHAWGQHNMKPGRTSSISVPIFRFDMFEAALTVIYFASAMSQSKAIERYLAALQQTAALIGEARSNYLDAEAGLVAGR
jgi:IclR family mhp operon transcriptional activator